MQEEEEEGEEVIEIENGILLGNNQIPLTKCQSFWKNNFVTVYFHNITTILGTKFVLFMVFSQLIGKGMLMALIGGVMLPIFKTKLGASATQAEIYNMLCLLPWSIKPIIGLCSDFIIICGFNKKGWLMIASITCIASLITIFVMTCVERLFVAMVVCCFIGVNFQVSMYDLLSEAKYSEIRNAHPELGSGASTLANGLITTGGLVVISFLGTLSDRELYWVIFLIALILGAAPLIPTLLGWMPEVKYVNAKVVQLVDMDRFRRDLPKILVVAFCGLGGILTSSLTVFVSPEVGLGVSLGMLLLCLGGCWRFFDEGITQVALYQVITTLSAPSVSSALSYFFTASDACLPNGPHFSYAYYISWAGLVSQILGLSAVFIYAKFLGKMKFRTVLMITTILQGLGGLCDLFIVLRWNLKLGLPDTWAYMIGGAVLEPVVDMLNWIPSNALISIMVEDGMEASCFAFLAGISNFARMATKLSGTIIFTLAGIETGVIGKVCNFDSLWWLVLICHVISPIVIGIPAVFLIPDMRQDEKKKEK